MQQPQSPRPSLAALLPSPIPACPTTRAIIVATRRMAIHGLHDASAVSLAIAHFHGHFRKILVLLRALVLELSQCAQHDICVAPCCTPRLTHHEAALVAALQQATAQPYAAQAQLARLTGSQQTGALLATTQALANALCDAGRPLLCP